MSVFIFFFPFSDPNRTATLYVKDGDGRRADYVRIISSYIIMNGISEEEEEEENYYYTDAHFWGNGRKKKKSK